MAEGISGDKYQSPGDIQRRQKPTGSLINACPMFSLLLPAACCWDSRGALECGHTLFIKRAASPRYRSDQHIALLNPVSRAWKCEGSGRREKVHAAAKNSNHLSRSGKSIGKGSEKTTFNPVASPMAPWSGSSLTPLLGSGQISVLSLSTLPSLQHCPHHLNRSPSASPLTCTWAGTVTIP